jgi:hypothetical protein
MPVYYRLTASWNHNTKGAISSPWEKSPEKAVDALVPRIDPDRRDYAFSLSMERKVNGKIEPVSADSARACWEIDYGMRSC